MSPSQKNGVPSEWQRKRLLAETFSCPWTHGRSAAEAVITVRTRQMAESRRAKCERGNVVMALGGFCGCCGVNHRGRQGGPDAKLENNLRFNAG
ncbi:hypothetical protein [uncultured Bacteroides sp.]|uniref:hypothetical protein n=1 Tax=uncultured Bacteroides sp. TaxID=162156 RepID=UPI00259BE241|nr:hypothetical protein [uncultured Bacteroides sp.]